MDPLSVTASVIAILKLTTEVLGLFISAKGASKDREQFTRELSNSYNLFISLQSRLESESPDGPWTPWFRSFKALGADNGALSQYRDALIELRHVARSKTGVAKVGSNVFWKFTKEDVVSIFLKIERIKSSIQIALAQDHFKLSEAIKSDVGIVRQNQEQLEKDDLLEWLSTSNYPVQQSDLIRKGQKGTGDWVLNSQEFQRWLATPKQTLFCPGMPGAGKTMLSAIMINHLTNAIQTTDVEVAYIYCSYKAQADQTLPGLLASILKQLAQSCLSSPKSLKELYNRHSSRKTQPLLEEILQTLQVVLANLKTTFIVVDALDKCPTEGNCRKKFVEALQNLQSKSDIRLMLTSRFDGDIKDQLFGSPMLEIRATEGDVRRFVVGRINASLELSEHDSSLQHDIENAIAQAVDGMFLLARFYVDSLEDKTTVGDIRKALESFSTNIGDPQHKYGKVYDDAVQRIENQRLGHRELARSVLTWITYAKRQLKVTELLHALAVKPDDRDLNMDYVCKIRTAVSVCAGLVTVDEQSGIVRFVHYTAQEYFEGTRERWDPRAEAKVASTCLIYMMFSGFQSGSSKNDDIFQARQQTYPFFDYAARYWGDHTISNENHVSKEALEFLRCPNAVDSASQALWIPGHRYRGYSQNYPRKTSALHLVARFGLCTVADQLYPVSHGQDIAEVFNSEQYDATTPVQVGAWYGKLDVVHWLIEKGADVNAQGGRYGNALYAASFGGHEQTVKLLVDKGADVNAQGGRYGNALQAASSKGLEHVNIQGISYLTALGCDCGRTCMELMQCFKTHGGRSKLLWPGPFTLSGNLAVL